MTDPQTYTLAQLDVTWQSLAEHQAKESAVLAALFVGECATPLGMMMIVVYQQAVIAIEFIKPQRSDALLQQLQRQYRTPQHQAFLTRAEHPLVQAAIEQLTQYFQGKRRRFDLPLAPHGTAFQQQAWQALLTIPYGETCSYQAQALSMANPKAVRAVGRANGANPISIVIPCHRVIGKSGQLTGYAGGLEKKQALLLLEGALTVEASSQV